MVVPYLDKNHWLHEEECCVHCNFVPRFHNDASSKKFACNVCITIWTLNEDVVEFATFVNVNTNTIIPKIIVQRHLWECGYQVVLNFKTYLHE